MTSPTDEELIAAVKALLATIKTQFAPDLWNCRVRDSNLARCVRIIETALADSLEARGGGEGLSVSQDHALTDGVALDQLKDWLRREAARRMDTGYRGAYDPTVIQLEGWIAALAKRLAR